MARIRVNWFEEVEYSTEIEVDGFDASAGLSDHNDEESDVMQAVLNLDKEEMDQAFDSVTERRLTLVEVVRAGDLTPEIKAPAPKHEEMF